MTVHLIAQPSVSRDRKPPSLDPLYEHGPVEVLIQAGEYPTFNPERCLKLVEDRLRNFDPDRDCLAWAGGDALAAVMAGVVLSDMAAEKGWESFTWLRYERPVDGSGKRTHIGAKYTPIKVPFYLDPSKGEPIAESLTEDLASTGTDD